MPLLASSLPDEEVVVFYTLQSPHMGYENVRLLKETEKTPVFIKCFEGRNALDFQLVTELGYRLRADEECEYVIISTDTGFDAAVRYWSSQKKKVRRVNGKECFRQATSRLRRGGADIADIPMAEPAQIKTDDVTADELEKPEADTVKKVTKAMESAEAAKAVEKPEPAEITGPTETAEVAESAEAMEPAEAARPMESSEATAEEKNAESANEQPEKARSGARRRRRRETKKHKVESTEAAAVPEAAKQVMQEVQPDAAASESELKEASFQESEPKKARPENPQQEPAAVSEQEGPQVQATEAVLTQAEEVQVLAEEVQVLTEAESVPEEEKAVRAEEAPEPTEEVIVPADPAEVPAGEVQAQTEKVQAQTEEVPVPAEPVPSPAAAESEPTSEVDDTEQIVTNLFRCIHKDNLADFHNAMVMFLGEEDGKRLYLEAKNSPECNAFWAEQADNSQKERFDIYCKMVFAHSEPAEEAPADFAEFLWKANGKRKNLNSLRAALQSQYGKDKGMKYYSLFKSHIKVMNRM